ncbi:Holliday junction resolvase RuvX [Chlamydiota bacterium]
MTVLGLDYGEKRIGVAISDENGSIAFPLLVLQRKNPEDDVRIIQELVQEKNIERIVVGMPINMNGTRGQKAHEVEIFCEFLKEKIAISVIEWDERLSTMQAERVLREAAVSGVKKRAIRDKLASQLILQSYLDARKQ